MANKIATQRAMSQYEQGQWDMFESITSIYNGKQMYGLQDCGMAYSRQSHKCMSVKEAYGEFLDLIGD